MLVAHGLDGVSNSVEFDLWVVVYVDFDEIGLADRCPSGLALEILRVDVFFCAVELVFGLRTKVNQEIDILDRVVFELNMFVEAQALFFEDVSIVPADETNILQIFISCILRVS